MPGRLGANKPAPVYKPAEKEAAKTGANEVSLLRVFCYIALCCNVLSLYCTASYSNIINTYI